MGYRLQCDKNITVCGCKELLMTVRLWMNDV